MTDIRPDVLGGAATVAHTERPRRTFLKRCYAFGRKIPWFAYVLAIYIAIALSVANVRETFIVIGPYALTWVEVIMMCGTLAAMFELLRVSKPGLDNTYDAIAMGAMFVVILILFVLASAGVAQFSIFGNTEFLFLLLVSLTQTIMAFVINARTLKRTIDYAGD